MIDYNNQMLKTVFYMTAKKAKTLIMQGKARRHFICRLFVKTFVHLTILLKHITIMKNYLEMEAVVLEA